MLSSYSGGLSPTSHLGDLIYIPGSIRVRRGGKSGTLTGTLVFPYQ